MPEPIPNPIDKPAAPRRRIARAGASIGLWLLLAAAVSASDWQGLEAGLAAKISALAAPGACQLEFRNRSSVPADEAERIHRQLLSELAGRGLTATGADRTGLRIKVTLSEDPRHYLWLAELERGSDTRAIAMVSSDRPASNPLRAPALTIDETPLWSEQRPILDIALLAGNPARMAVLDPDHLSFYSQRAGAWQAAAVFDIPHARAWPRDLRGRLLSPDGWVVNAYLPGLECQAPGNPASGLSCRETDDPWPLDFSQSSRKPPAPSGFFAPLRNFFTGRLMPAMGNLDLVPPFYSAAPIARGDETLWLLAATDGRFHLVDQAGDQIVSSPAQAGDVASLESGCGSGWQVLAVASVFRSGDRIQAYEVSGYQLLPLGQPIDLPGAVTALWTESEGKRVIAVTHSAGSESYEAFQLDVACRH